MTLGSLRLRLLVAWAILIVLTLLFSAASLRALYERGITRRTLSNLTVDIQELKERLQISKSGKIKLRRFPTDPQFHIPFGGRYWQIFSGNDPVLSSRSLQGTVLRQKKGVKRGQGVVELDLHGPRQQEILALERAVEIPDGGDKTRALIIVAGVNKSDIQSDANEFTDDIRLGLIAIAIVLMFAGWVHVSIGLSPLMKLKSVLAEVRAGVKKRIGDRFPDEVMPLINETNSLLDEQDEAIEAARLRASNLAHGLKTPLAILAAESRSLRKDGALSSADLIDAQVEILRHHVERELALVRARGTTKMRANRLDASSALQELCGALQKLPESELLSWRLDLPAKAFVNVDRIDFNNIMGNLLDNARKWAKAELSVQVSPIACGVMVIIEDDGAGIPEDQITRLLRPGERDASDVDGAGLGLAIVMDLLEIYQGKLGFSTSSLGGTRVSVQLPLSGS